MKKKITTTTEEFDKDGNLISRATTVTEEYPAANGRHYREPKQSTLTDAMKTLNQLPGGLYRTISDRAEICFLHDKRKLNESEVIWQIEPDRCWLTDDGCNTWTRIY